MTHALGGMLCSCQKGIVFFSWEKGIVYVLEWNYFLDMLLNESSKTKYLNHFVGRSEE